MFPNHFRFDRRMFLRVSLFTTLSSAAPSYRSQPAFANPGGRNRLPVIVLFMSGGPSQKETFNPDEPKTPVELRGDLGRVSTPISGVHFCELWPQLARRANRFSLLRGVASGSSDHFASAVNMLQAGSRDTLGVRWGERAADGGVPYVIVETPSLFSVMAALQASKSLHIRWRRSHDEGAGKSDWERNLMGPGDYQAPEMKADPRLAERRQLLESFDRFPVANEATERRDRNYELAFSLMLGGGQFFEAFNPSTSERAQYERDLERYGSESRVGRGLLLARRLVERGAGFCVLYNELGRGWDMHDQIFPRMRDLAGQTDQAAAALLDDMQRDRVECVFLMVGEFGRTPRVNASAGRDHWPDGFPAILAGGRTRKGVVHGRTSAQGEIRDGRVETAAIGPTVIYAAGGEIGPTEPRVREILEL